MSNVRYPENPRISTTGRKIEIEYNGIRVSLVSTPKGNAFYSGLTKIDRDLRGIVTESEFEEFQGDNLMRKRPVYNPAARQQVLEMITSYATWFDDETTAELDRLLFKNSRKYLKEIIQEQHAQMYQTGENPNKAYIDAQRRRFRDAWTRILRDNITDPETIEKLLGE